MSLVTPDVEAAKQRGNAHFAAKEFRAAECEYAAAIAALGGADSRAAKQLCAADRVFLAVLCGNRAAARASLNNGAAALEDAYLAAHLHPTWAKGSLRLGRLLAKAGKAREAERVLSAALEHAQRLNDPLLADIKTELEKAKSASWSHTEKMGRSYLDKMKAKAASSLGAYPPPNSFAFLVLESHSNFEKGMDWARALKIEVVGGQQQVNGKLGGLMDICNAVLGESMGVALQAGDDQAISQYAYFECYGYKGLLPPFTQTADEIVATYVQRRGDNPNWDQFRPSYSSTIRASIIGAWLYMAGRQLKPALQLITLADNIIKGLQAQFQDVPAEDKGACLKPSFHRLVRRFRANILCISHEPGLDVEAESIFLSIINEIESNTDQEPFSGVAALLYERVVLFDCHEGLAGIYNNRFARGVEFKPNVTPGKMYTLPDDQRVKVSPHAEPAMRHYAKAVELTTLDDPSRVMYIHMQLRFSLLVGIRYGDLKKLYNDCEASWDLVEPLCRHLTKIEDDLKQASVWAFKMVEDKLLAQVDEIEFPDGSALEDLVLSPISVATTNYYQ